MRKVFVRATVVGGAVTVALVSTLMVPAQAAAYCGYQYVCYGWYCGWQLFCW